MSLDFDGKSSGGGSGGQTIQYDVMPPPVLGDIIQYVGETTANYTQGYFYKGSSGSGGSATISQTLGNDISNLEVDAETFETGMETVLSGSVSTGNYNFEYVFPNGWQYNSNDVDIDSIGITFSYEGNVNAFVMGEGISNIEIDRETFYSGADISTAGTLSFVFENQEWLLNGVSADPANYGITYDDDIIPESITLDQYAGNYLDISFDEETFKEYVSEVAGEYFLQFNGEDWIDLTTEETIDLADYGITIISGEPVNGQEIYINYKEETLGPLEGTTLEIQYMPVIDGDIITVAYSSGGVSWQQIDVQPTPEIATQTTIDGNTELSADSGVLVVDTPDGTQDKQVANVEFVNNLVGDVASLLSEV